MLEIEDVSWSNFLSYGDSITKVDLRNLGQVLISGEILPTHRSAKGERYDPTAKNHNFSNGAGKSSIPNAILWCIFGRTMHKAAPGAKVVNWHGDGRCWVEINLKGGDRITRTITKEGKTELIFVRDGDETRLTSDTLATTKLQQQKLNREFMLDWDFFCGSSFFNQYSRPWMEMNDQGRKQAMERELHIDRFSLYGTISGEKATYLDQRLNAIKAVLSGLEQDLKRSTTELEKHQITLEGYEGEREIRIARELTSMKETIADRDSIKLPDLDALKARWEIVAQVRAKIKTMRAEGSTYSITADKYRLDIESLTRRREDVRAKIRKWEQRDGKVCNQCEQTVPHEHASGKIEPLQEEIEEISILSEKAERSRAVAIAEMKKRTDGADGIEVRLNAKLPKLTLQEALIPHKEWKNLDEEIKRRTRRIDEISAETNPHHIAIADSTARLNRTKAQIEKLKSESEELIALRRHYTYIQRSYTDRKCIKSLAIAEHLPFVNSRLAYYLDVFELDLVMQFTNALGIESNKWGYEFYCGGERKRTDLAIMFAMFDLHEKMYGRQSNIMVLDEVDGRLDGSGIAALIQIIKNDLAYKVDTILVISHKPEMRDVFPRQIHVVRDGEFSRLEEIR